MTWIADRSEHFLGDAQGRDNVTTARLALDEKHRFLALDVDLVANMGAYLSQFASYIPYFCAVLSWGVYNVPACDIRLSGVYTNKVPVDAYRGAGRPEAAYVISRRSAGRSSKPEGSRDRRRHSSEFAGKLITSSKKLASMLHGEHVCVKVGNPLLTLLRDSKVA